MLRKRDNKIDTDNLPVIHNINGMSNHKFFIPLVKS
jgi:hypothetical protein